MARLIIWFLFTLALSTTSLAAKAETEAQMLERASKSFSSYSFDTPLSKIEHKLVRVDSDACRQSIECGYADKNDVEHYFWFDDPPLLVLKTIDVRKMSGRKIKAMDIGRARNKSAVLARVDRFFNGRQIDCDEYPNEYDAVIVCGVNLGEGWTKLYFDKAIQLVYIRLDAYQFV
jgi:hypothetical protein